MGYIGQDFVWVFMIDLKQRNVLSGLKLFNKCYFLWFNVIGKIINWWGNFDSVSDCSFETMASIVLGMLKMRSQVMKIKTTVYFKAILQCQGKNCADMCNGFICDVNV